MRILRNIVALVGGILMLASCDDNVSYAELLNRENLAVNNFLADQVVLLDIPADTVFEVGPDAPYYRLDEDGQLYMQVLNAGTPGYKVQYNEQIFPLYTLCARGLQRWKTSAGNGKQSVAVADVFPLWEL